MELVSVLEPAIGLIMWQIFVLSFIVIAIIAIIDIAMNKFANNQKFIWLLICLFVPFGGLIYFFIGRKQRIKV